MNGLKKKAVTADGNLGAILGVPAGTMVSYADIQKGLHEYIRKHNLKGETPQLVLTAEPQPVAVSAPEPIAEAMLTCASCGAAVPATAAFCDQCGASQR